MEALRKAVEQSFVETRWYGGNAEVKWLESLKFDGPSWYKELCECRGRFEDELLFSDMEREIPLIEFKTEKFKIGKHDHILIMSGQCKECKVLFLRERIR